MLSHHIQKNSPGLLYIPAKYEKSAPYSIGAIARTKCGAGGAGGLASPIYKQASLAGRLNISTNVIQLATTGIVHTDNILQSKGYEPQ